MSAMILSRFFGIMACLLSAYYLIAMIILAMGLKRNKEPSAFLFDEFFKMLIVLILGVGLLSVSLAI